MAANSYSSRGIKAIAKRYWHWVLVPMAVSSVAFILSPLDATIRGDFIIEQFTKNPTAMRAGLAAFGITLAIEGISSILVQAGLHFNTPFSRFARQVAIDSTPYKTAIRNKTKEKATNQEITPQRGVFAWLNSVMTGLAIGSGFDPVINRREQSLPKRLLQTATVVLPVSLVIGFAGWVGGGGINWFRANDLGWLGDGIVQWVPDWRLWTGIVAVTVIAPVTWGNYWKRWGMVQPKKVGDETIPITAASVTIEGWVATLPARKAVKGVATKAAATVAPKNEHDKRAVFGRQLPEIKAPDAAIKLNPVWSSKPFDPSAPPKEGKLKQLMKR